MILDPGHAFLRVLVSPDRIGQRLRLCHDGLVIGIAFVRAMCGLVRAIQKGHRDVVTREVDDRRIVTLAQFERIAAFAQNGPTCAHRPCSGCFADRDMISHGWSYCLASSVGCEGSV